MSTSYLSASAFKSRTVLPPADVDALAQLRWTKQLADATAAAVSEETPFGIQQQVPATGTLVWVTFTPLADLAADAVNYATLTVSKRTAGGPAVIVASGSTTPGSMGSWTSGVPIAVPIVAGAVSAEDILTVSIAKHGTGVIVPAGLLSALPSPSFIDINLADWSSEINARLRKRYAVPFALPAPAVVDRWLTKLCTRDCYARRGFNPSAADDREAIIDEANAALAEIKEAADAKDGLFDLPLLDNDAASGIARGGPLVYSEQSPYSWTDIERTAGRSEDFNGR